MLARPSTRGSLRTEIGKRPAVPSTFRQHLTSRWQPVKAPDSRKAGLWWRRVWAPMLANNYSQGEAVRSQALRFTSSETHRTEGIHSADTFSGIHVGFILPHIPSAPHHAVSSNIIQHHPHFRLSLLFYL